MIGGSYQLYRPVFCSLYSKERCLVLLCHFCNVYNKLLLIGICPFSSTYLWELEEHTTVTFVVLRKTNDELRVSSTNWLQKGSSDAWRVLPSLLHATPLSNWKENKGQNGRSTYLRAAVEQGHTNGARRVNNAIITSLHCISNSKFNFDVQFLMMISRKSQYRVWFLFMLSFWIHAEEMDLALCVFLNIFWLITNTNR